MHLGSSNLCLIYT